MAIKKPSNNATPPPAPLKARPPVHFSATAPPGFAIPEKRAWPLSGWRRRRTPADTPS